jgi:hypothetical protein
MAVRLKLPYGTLSYPALAEPRKVGDATKATYSAVIIFPEGADLSELETACVAAAEEKWGADRTKKMLASQALKWPIKSGDQYSAKKPGNEVYEGRQFINMKSDEQPGLVGPRAGPDGRPERLAPAEFYPGCIVRASITVYPYDHPQGGKGIGVGLNNLQFVKHGKRLDNRRRAEDEFDVIEEDADELEDAIDPLAL